MGGGLESSCVGRVYGAVRRHGPHSTRGKEGNPQDKYFPQYFTGSAKGKDA